MRVDLLEKIVGVSADRSSEGEIRAGYLDSYALLLSSYFNKATGKISLSIRTHNEGLKVFYFDRGLKEVIVREFAVKEDYSFDNFYPIPEKDVLLATSNFKSKGFE